MIQYIEISDDDSDGQSPPFKDVMKDPPLQHLHHFGTPPDQPLFARGRIMEPAIRDGAAVEPRASAMLEPHGAHSSSSLLGMRQADWNEEDQGIIRVFKGGLAENHRISKPGGPSALGQENKVAGSPRESEVTEAECINRVLTVFGDISVDYVSNLYNQISKSPDNLVAHILDQMDKGADYPRAEDPKKKLKRKRVVDEEKEAILKYDTADRIVPPAAYTVRQET
jgi:TRIAD3 protein (E3 ubiquitin-protein ligase RNF216)